MATATEALPDELVDEPETGGGRKRLVKRLLVVLAVLAIVAIECLVAYCYLPSTATAEQADHAGAAHSPPPAPAPKEESHGDSHGGGHDEGHGDEHGGGHAITEDVMEVELGEFTITAFQPASAMTIRIECHVFGTIATVDEPEFRALMEHRGNRVRDNIIVTIRSADLTDLTDARLGLIKRTILETTNHTLGKPFLESVVFSDFMFMEQ